MVRVFLMVGANEDGCVEDRGHSGKSIVDGGCTHEDVCVEYR